jgi:hypothetical protein
MNEEEPVTEWLGGEGEQPVQRHQKRKHLGYWKNLEDAGVAEMQ